jgi:hypothetical protein
MRNKRTVSPLGKVFGFMALGIISIGVMIFLGSHSLNFFTYTFTNDDALFAWLGLLLTSIGAVFWLGIFLWNADTTLRQAIALIMMVAALAGEMITAVFDMQNSALYATGFQFLPEEMKQMTEVIGYLGAFTGVMLILYTAGDAIVNAFKDDDGDGTINLIDPDYKPAEKPKQNKGSIFSNWFKKEPAPAIVQNNAIVGQPRIDVSGLSPEQILDLMKHAQELEAANKVGQGSANGNGQHTNP